MLILTLHQDNNFKKPEEINKKSEVEHKHVQPH